MTIPAVPEIQNRFTAALPADPEPRNFRRQVNAACYSFVQPATFPNAALIAWSHELGTELGLSPDILGNETFTKVFSGQQQLPGMQPYAMCYGGHQFGHWAGQLGDGRAINLGEVATPSGQHQVLQLKGAGPTPYSRGADGLAVLRSSIREFLCSEAMHHLGVPTTRALSLIGTGETVVRDMFYDGNPQAEPGAIVCRVAPSFVRFGNFEILTVRKEFDLLQKLADFTICRDFPALLQGTPFAAAIAEEPCLASLPAAAPCPIGEPAIYAAWFTEICRRTATMIVHWMRVGFVHGVMNTDNMSILGLTIDYGPYGWLENHDPNWTPNTTDAEGRRYRYGAQPQIALWNLVQLANALYPLVNAVPPLEAGIEEYKKCYEREWLAMMRAKLGLATEQADDAALAEQLLQTFTHTETDMTLFYRGLAEVDFDADSTALGTDPSRDSANAFAAEAATIPASLRHAWYDPEPAAAAQQALRDWLASYRARLQQEQTSPAQRKEAMDSVNPLYVPRNYLAQLAIDAAHNGDYTKLEELMSVLKQPYTEQTGKAHLAAKRPDWARHKAGCSMLSCSS